VTGVQTCALPICELLKLAVTRVPGIRPETTMQCLLTVTLNRRPEDRVAGNFNGRL
jgi:hypothetical protein